MIEPALESHGHVKFVPNEFINNRPLNEGICINSYGVYFSIDSNNANALRQLLHYLPPKWRLSASSSQGERYTLLFELENKRHSLLHQGEPVFQSETLETVLDAFDGHIRLRLGLLVEDRLFVHAGVVGWQGQAIVIPGFSFSGKTTLVAALVKAGASYYSDEYALLDAEGLVHPYPRPMSVRQMNGSDVKRIPVEEMGGIAGVVPLPVGLIVSTQYQPGAAWNPKRISSGQSVLALLNNTLAARSRPEFALPVLANAVSGACSIEGCRGDADEVAIALLSHKKLD